MQLTQGSAIPALSIVVPAFDEEACIPALVEALDEVRPDLPSSEVVVVDDGSRDDTFARLEDAAATRPWLHVVRLRARSGQSAALAAGFDHSLAPLVVTMDADLQNDPSEIPRLLARLDEGFDLVIGWRRGSRVAWLSRRLPSIVANAIIRALTSHVAPVHDTGCGLKAYRRWVVEATPLRGEMHRFVPVLAAVAGARVAEIEIGHRPRRGGRSRYGLGRVYPVVCDLLTVRFLARYRHKPAHFFAGPAAVMLAIGVGAAALVVVELAARERWISLSALAIIAALFVASGTLAFLMGLLAELSVHARAERPYLVAELRNFDDPTARSLP